MPGCSECLGSAHPCSGSQLARFGNSGLWTRIRVWDCRHVCVSTITVSVRLNRTTIVWYNLYVWYSQDKGSVRMITLTKTDSSQVDALAHFKKCCWSILLQKVFLKTWLFLLFQISSLQIRNLPSMTVCYSLDVSSVSCLVQTKTNMVKKKNSTKILMHLNIYHFILIIFTMFCVSWITGLHFCGWRDLWGTRKVRSVVFHCTFHSHNFPFKSDCSVFFFFCSSRAEPVAAVVVKCFTEALPENRWSFYYFLLGTLIFVSPVQHVDADGPDLSCVPSF